jgi:hypothetical protein
LWDEDGLSRLNPKVRVPMCVNAAAARSYLLRFTKETEWGLEAVKKSIQDFATLLRNR